MEINILNPRARKLIQELENLELISINKKTTFSALARNLRKKVAARLSVDNIAKEVALVRKKRKAVK